MSQNIELTVSGRIRKSPYYNATIRYGVKTFTVYNHMLMPTSYEDPEKDYWNLVNNVTVWDVAGERQVEISGPESYRFVEYITPRDLSKLQIGQGKYALITDENGGIINDPIILRISKDKFWLSIADSDVLLWTKGLAEGLGWNVKIREPDVSPLAIQGPNNLPLMIDLLGEWVSELKYFFFKEFELDGIPLIVQRSGWSKQGGFELYLMDGTRGEELWERVMEVGMKYDIKPATPNNIERIESGLFSWGNDMNIENNPLELPLNNFIQIDKGADYICREALQRISSQGVKNKIVGLVIDGEQLPGACENNWNIFSSDKLSGKVTSTAYSPRLKQNIAFATVDSHLGGLGTKLDVETPWGRRSAKVSKIPFN